MKRSLLELGNPWPLYAHKFAFKYHRQIEYARGEESVNSLREYPTMKNSGELTCWERQTDEEAAECIEAQSPQRTSETRLQDLIPIAMVIVGGCELCAESMVNRALKQGSSWQVIARMEKPLAAGRRTLETASGRER